MNQPDRFDLDNCLPLDEAVRAVAEYRMATPGRPGHIKVVRCLPGLAALAEKYLSEPFWIGGVRYEFDRVTENAHAPGLIFRVFFEDPK